VLGPCPATVLRTGRHCLQRKTRAEGAGDLAFALEAVSRIDLLFDIKWDSNGVDAAERLRLRESSAPLVIELKPGCGPSGRACSVRPPSSSKSTTCCDDGTVSPASSTAAGSV
jgi:hypothetical protein